MNRRTVELTDLAKWLMAAMAASGYKSANQLSLDAGLSHGKVSGILNGAQPEALTLVKLSRVLGVPVVDAFVATGWVTEEEASQRANVAETRLLRRFRLLRPRSQQLLLGLSEDLLGQGGREA